MKTLILVASRHGSTNAIAQALADALRSADQTVDVKTVDDAPSVENYDAPSSAARCIWVGGCHRHVSLWSATRRSWRRCPSGSSAVVH